MSAAASRWSTPVVAGCAALTGILQALALPPGSFAWLAFVAPAPLALAVRRARAGTARSAGLGLVGGLGLGLFGTSWLVGTCERFLGVDTWVAWWILLTFAVWEALPFAAWAALVGWIGEHGTARTRVILSACGYVALETAFPTAFDYHSAAALAEVPVAIQSAEIWGAPGVVFVVALTSCTLVEGVLAPWRRWGWLVAAAAIPALACGLGALRLRVVERELASAPRVRVALVQLQLPLGWEDSEAALAAFHEGHRHAAAAGARVAILPESAYPWGIRLPFAQDFPAEQHPVRGTEDIALLFATTGWRNERPFPQNVAYLVAGSGEVLATYAKVHLIPFGERIPLVPPALLLGRIPGLSQYDPGDGPRRLEIPGPARSDPGSAAPGPAFIVGPMICYEDNVASHARALATQPGGIHAFVNLTNDSWFGQSDEPWQHLALATFRAVEHRIPLLRAVNGGVTTVVDAGGRRGPDLGVVAQAAHPEPRLLIADVALPRSTADRPTLYARGGWVFPWLCGLVLVAGVGSRRARSVV